MVRAFTRMIYIQSAFFVTNTDSGYYYALTASHVFNDLDINSVHVKCYTNSLKHLSIDLDNIIELYDDSESLYYDYDLITNAFVPVAMHVRSKQRRAYDIIIAYIFQQLIKRNYRFLICNSTDCHGK